MTLTLKKKKNLKKSGFINRNLFFMIEEYTLYYKSGLDLKVELEQNFAT